MMLLILTEILASVDIPLDHCGVVKTRVRHAHGKSPRTRERFHTTHQGIS
jgi:hypothetical protein